MTDSLPRSQPAATRTLTMTPHEIALLRLVAQRIAGPGSATAVDAVRWLGAVQAQDLPGALTSVALRTTGGTRPTIEAALNAAEVVRSWPMRGTLHLVPAEDLGWLLGLTAPRMVASAAARRAQLDLDKPTLDRFREVAVSTLAGGHQLSRDELHAAWSGAGLATTGQRGYHALGYLAQTGTLCLGPVRGGEQLVALIDEWIRSPRRLDRDEALGELAERYFKSHGPASVKDFTRWTGLVAADARTALAVARPRLARLVIDSVEYFLDPLAPDRLGAHRDHAQGVFLLPGFDEFVLGYADRGAMLPAEFADHIVPGGNGVFRPTVVSAGQIVGTWKYTGRGAKRTVLATPFEAFPDQVADAIPEAYAARTRPDLGSDCGAAGAQRVPDLPQ